MKSMLLASFLVVVSIQLRAQQQLCFSDLCQQTQVGSFQNAQQGPLYKPGSTVPAYKPVMPLAPSISTQQFFVHSISERALCNPFTSFNNTGLAPRIPLGRLHRPVPIPPDRAPAALSFSSGAKSTNSSTTGSQDFAGPGGHTK